MQQFSASAQSIPSPKHKIFHQNAPAKLALQSPPMNPTPTIHDKVTPEQLDDLYHRRITVIRLAKILGYSVSWVSKALPARKPRRDFKILRKTRKEFQFQAVQRYLDQQLSAKQAAAQAYVSERTFFRRLREYRSAQS
jgi:predicted transcriptional regulator